MNKFKKFCEAVITNRSQINEGDHDLHDNDAGEKFWGNVGAGILPICSETKRILVAYRSKYVNEPHSWGIFGGKIDDKETPLEAAKREIEEETGHTVHMEKVIPAYVFKSPGGGFTYHNFIGIVKEEFDPKLDWETETTKWITYEELLALPKKHFGLEALLKHSGNIIKEQCSK